MIRLPMLAAAALLLPNTGAKLAEVAERPAAVASVSAEAFPGLKLPKFLRGNRKRGVEHENVAMKTRLRDVMLQQEAFYAQNKSYTRNVAKLAGAPSDTSGYSVQVQILYANSKGWTAVASHPNAPGRSCVAYVGQPESFPLIPRTRLEGNSAVTEGMPVCDSK